MVPNANTEYGHSEKSLGNKVQYFKALIAGP